MARIITYTMVMTGILLLMAMMGLPTATNGIVNAVTGGNAVGTDVGDISNAKNSIVYLAVLVVLASSLAGIAIGVFTKQSAESFIVSSFAASIAGLSLIDFISLYNYFNGICPVGSSCSFIRGLAILIIVPLLAGFYISIIQWWRGNDI